MPTLNKLALAAILLGAFVGPAGAETPIRLDPPGGGVPRRAAIRLSSPYDAGQALKTQGIARTSIDRSWRDQASTASIGFLCGMQPSTRTHGGAGALGVDTEGRFLGAQLRFGFR